MSMSVEQTLALEELKLIQTVISRQESLRLTLRGWAIGLVSILTVSFLSSKLLLPRAQYVAGVVFLCVLFFWLEVVHRVAENRAMERCENIELFLRGGTPTYGGPLIGKSLARPNSLRDQLKAADNLRIYLPYLVLIIGAISIAVLAPVRASDAITSGITPN